MTRSSLVTDADDAKKSLANLGTDRNVGVR